MKILISTMGKHLEVGANLVELLKDKISFEMIGFLVADSKFYKKFTKKNSFINDNHVSLIKEWEYTSLESGKEPDLERIGSYEKKLDVPSFWYAIMSDRRIFFGKYCKSKQHYSPRFSEKELMQILDQALCQIDLFFKTKTPDLVLSFGTSILGDYLIYLFAKYYKVPYLQLKATKVKNYLSLHDTPIGISSHIIENYSEDIFSEGTTKESEAYINSVKKKGLQYEGAILSSRSRLMGKLKRAPINQIKSIYSSIQNLRDPIVRNDCHMHGGFIPSLYSNFINPINSFYIEKRLRGNEKFLTSDKLDLIGDFVFFPLHFEPEVSIQVFGRPYQNQIELIRNIALNIPVGTKVVVKEHPRSLGFRSFSYYRKLLEIPNVYLIDPFIPAFQIVQRAKLVAVITGSIGLEASIIGRPVITFGEVAYNILPDTMVQKIENLNTMGDKIGFLLKNYHYSHEHLLKYINSIIKGSVPVDLYSILMNKKSRFSENFQKLSQEERLEKGYHRLSVYCYHKFSKCVNLSDTQRVHKQK